jgi:hypothetical protein
MGQVAVMGAEGARGRGRLRDQPGGGRSLKRNRVIQAVWVQ